MSSKPRKLIIKIFAVDGRALGAFGPASHFRQKSCEDRNVYFSRAELLAHRRQASKERNPDWTSLGRLLSFFHCSDVVPLGQPALQAQPRRSLGYLLSLFQCGLRAGPEHSDFAISGQKNAFGWLPRPALSPKSFRNLTESRDSLVSFFSPSRLYVLRSVRGHRLRDGILKRWWYSMMIRGQPTSPEKSKFGNLRYTESSRWRF